MLLNPRYGDDPVLVDRSPTADPATPLVRQRDRLGEVLAGLTDEQWAAPSRCAGWSVSDVVSHLVTTNQFWSASVDGARRGEPTTILTAFDPVATPAALVDATRDAPAGAVLERYLQTSAALRDLVEAIDDWTVVGEAPPGHVALSLVAAHALWDAWTHERDILLPLGLEQERYDDEITMSLRYAAALSPALAATNGASKAGVLALDATEPDHHVTITLGPTVVLADGEPAEVATLTLAAPAVDLVEALTFRNAMPCAVPAESAWVLAGLDAAFDRV